MANKFTTNYSIQHFIKNQHLSGISFELIRGGILNLDLYFTHTFINCFGIFVISLVLKA